MSESKTRSKNAYSRLATASMSRALRKLLRQRTKPKDPKSKEIWAEKVGANLISIASEKKSATGLQAIKMVIDNLADPIVASTLDDEHEQVPSKASLRAKSAEEIEAEIKELRERLGSVAAPNS